MSTTHLPGPGPGRWAALAVLGFCLGVPGCANEQRQAEARGAAYADSVAAAYGGMEAWEALRFVRFDLSIREGIDVQARARHLWNRTSGEYRYEADLAALRAWGASDLAGDGKLVAILNRGTGAGRARVERAPVETTPLPGEAALLALARARIEDDGTTLFFPFLLRDAGTKLRDLGMTTTPRGRTAREIQVLRKGAPAVRMFLDPETHRILETERAMGGVPVSLLWRSEVPVGGVTLMAERQIDSNHTRIFDLLAAPERIAPEVFTDFSRRMPY